MIWTIISLGCDLHARTLDSVRYRKEIIDQSVHLYTASPGNYFIPLGDNAGIQRVLLADDYFDNQGLERVEWFA